MIGSRVREAECCSYYFTTKVTRREITYLHILAVVGVSYYVIYFGRCINISLYSCRFDFFGKHGFVEI